VTIDGPIVALDLCENGKFLVNVMQKALVCSDMPFENNKEM
jgi:hypothetical protein